MGGILERALAQGGDCVRLPRGEYRECVTVDRPCTVVGDGTTLWNGSEPVVSVRSEGVTLKNLRLESIGADGYGGSPTVLEVLPDTVVEGVEVYGYVAGDATFRLPRSLHLGAFAPNVENRYRCSLYLPEPCDVKVRGSNFRAYLADLGGGRTELKLVTEPIEEGGTLYGEIVYTSRYVRRTYVDGIATIGAPQGVGEYVYSYLDPQPNPIGGVYRAPDAPTTVPKPEAPKSPPPTRLLRGRHTELGSTALSLKLSYRCVGGDVAVDPYVFLTDGSGVATRSDGVAYFGNPTLEGGSVSVGRDGTVRLLLDGLPSEVSKVWLCYSVYCGGSNRRTKTFSDVEGLRLSLYRGSRVLYTLDVDGLEGYSSVVLAELYRHADRWSLLATVEGYPGGLPSLCREFGIVAEY